MLQQHRYATGPRPPYSRPCFRAVLASHGKYPPSFICREFDEYLQCGRLEHGFLRVRCETCRHEKLVAFSCKRRGFCPSCGARRMADCADRSRARFRWVKAPTSDELTQLTHTIAQRVARYPERQGRPQGVYAANLAGLRSRKYPR